MKIRTKCIFISNSVPCFIVFTMFWNVASARYEISLHKWVWCYCAVAHFRRSINCKEMRFFGSSASFSFMFLYILYKPGVGKLVRCRSHLQKTKNTSEPQNRFLVFTQTWQRMQVLHEIMYSNCHLILKSTKI